MFLQPTALLRIALWIALGDSLLNPSLFRGDEALGHRLCLCCFSCPLPHLQTVRNLDSGQRLDSTRSMVYKTYQLGKDETTSVAQCSRPHRTSPPLWRARRSATQTDGTSIRIQRLRRRAGSFVGSRLGSLRCRRPVVRDTQTSVQLGRGRFGKIIRTWTTGC